MQILKNEPLSKHTSFRIGGPAKFFIEAKSREELEEALNWAKKNKIRYFILGNGTNLLISDKGLDYLVIKISLKKHSLNLAGNSIFAEAGCSLHSIVDDSVGNNLTGMEELAGIPGSLGGAIWANAGAFRKDISMVIESVTVLRNGKLITLTNKQCGFKYRDSIFKDKKNKDIIISAVLKLEKGDKKERRKKIDEIIEKRKCTQPLAFPSAGCAFKNVFIKTKKKFKKEIPHEFLEKKVIPAAWLIDQSGLKGLTIGGAQVSEIHSNFIINRNKATAFDVLKLIGIIKREVFGSFGVKLEEEVEFVE